MLYDTPEPFDSVILAGGFGSRMSPLTDTLPKPMLPVCGESAFSRILGSLRRGGFFSTAATTMYLPEKIEAFRPDGKGSLSFRRELTPKGSAGEMRTLMPECSDHLLIVSGDAICGFDFGSLRKEYLSSGARAAIVLKRMRRVQEYGSVVLENGLVTGFCEKPSARDILSDLVSTGIYFVSKELLSLIPEDWFYDFGHDFFPMLLEKGIPVAGLVPEGYWFDIGSFSEYFRCNMLFSGGKSCISDTSRISAEARISESIVFDRVSIGDSTVTGCIIASGAVVGDGCMLLPGCVIGEGAVIKSGACLSEGSIIGPGETVLPRSSESSFAGVKNELLFSDDCIMLPTASDAFSALGRAISEYGSAAVTCDGSAYSSLKCDELSSGLRSGGSDCTVFGCCIPSLAGFITTGFGFGTAVHLKVNGSMTEIRLYDGFGMPFPRERLRRLPLAMGKPQKAVATPGERFVLPRSALIKRYCDFLRKANSPALPIGICVGNGGSGNLLLAECAEALGFDIEEEGDIWFVSEDGDSLSALTPDGREASYWQLFSICCLLEGKKEVCLPRYAPVCVERLLSGRGMNVLFYGDGDSVSRRNAGSDRLLRDGVELCLTLACLLKKEGLSLGSALCMIPPFAVIKTIFDCDTEDIPSVIAEARLPGGLTARSAGFDHSSGRVSLFASADGGIKLMAEAVSFELAEEFSASAISELKRIRGSTHVQPGENVPL